MFSRDDPVLQFKTIVFHNNITPHNPSIKRHLKLRR